MNSTECSDATEEQLHPEAYLWRILCGTTAGAVYGHCGQNRRSVVVADDCSLPKHSLLVRQITSSGQHGPLVLSVDSTKKGLGLSRSQVTITYYSVAETCVPHCTTVGMLVAGGESGDTHAAQRVRGGDAAAGAS